MIQKFISTLAIALAAITAIPSKFLFKIKTVQLQDTMGGKENCSTGSI
jgi:hypothetical protein